MHYLKILSQKSQGSGRTWRRKEYDQNRVHKIILDVFFFYKIQKWVISQRVINWISGVIKLMFESDSSVI